MRVFEETTVFDYKVFILCPIFASRFSKLGGLSLGGLAFSHPCEYLDFDDSNLIRVAQNLSVVYKKHTDESSIVFNLVS